MPDPQVKQALVKKSPPDFAAADERLKSPAWKEDLPHPFPAHRVGTNQSSVAFTAKVETGQAPDDFWQRLRQFPWSLAVPKFETVACACWFRFERRARRAFRDPEE